MVGLGCTTRVIPTQVPLREVPPWYERWHADDTATRVGGRVVLIDLTVGRGVRKLRELLRARRPYPALGRVVTLAVDHRAMDRKRVREAIDATARVSRVWIAATRSAHPLTDADLARIANIEALDGFVLASAGETTEQGLSELLSRQPSLRVLRLHSARVTDDLVEQIGRLPQLRQLDLSNTAITDASMPKLAALPRLESLILSNTAVTDAGLAELSKLESLRSLGFDATHPDYESTLSGRAFEALGQLPRLSELSLSGRRGLDLNALAQLRHLRVLDLSRSRGWSLAEPLGALANLQELNLSDSGVSQLEGLEQLAHLRILDVSETTVEGSELIHLHGLPHLDVVYVGPRISCDREGSIPVSCDRQEARTW